MQAQHTKQTILDEFQEDILPDKKLDIFNLESSLRSRWKGTFYTQDDKLIHTLNQIEVVSKLDISCLISGPSGVGKEALAYRLHNGREGKFVVVNCGAIPSELIEAEFFGAKKGSYTGCVKDREGLFQQANHGTLFLDEIGELPLSMQAKLLRALETQRARAIGGQEDYGFRCRVVAATNKNLPEMMDKEEFRSDLYFRIAKLTFSIPPIAKRIDDLEMMFIYYYSKIFNQSPSEYDTNTFIIKAKEGKIFLDQGNCRAIINYVFQLMVNKILPPSTQ
jgi:two-component system response regulator GlrR